MLPVFVLSRLASVPRALVDAVAAVESQYWDRSDV